MMRSPARMAGRPRGGHSAWMAALGLMLSLVCQTAASKIVVLKIDLPLDQVGAGQPAKVGEHHAVRVFYDDATVDTTTGRVRVIQMQHFDHDQWQPQTLDPVAMPMIDAWLDLRSRPVRYHFRAALSMQGMPIFVTFDEVSGRFAIVQQKDLSVLIAGPYVVAVRPESDVDVGAALRAPPAYIGLDCYVTLDRVEIGEAGRPGDVDRLRVVYDANAIDPTTRRVKLLNLQHFRDGQFEPSHPDANMMPMSEAWLDLSESPYRLHYRADVTHGRPLLIEIDENSRRLTIRGQQPDREVLRSGTYGFDPTPLSGAEVMAAAVLQ